MNLEQTVSLSQSNEPGFCLFLARYTYLRLFDTKKSTGLIRYPPTVLSVSSFGETLPSRSPSFIQAFSARAFYCSVHIRSRRNASLRLSWVSPQAPLPTQPLIIIIIIPTAYVCTAACSLYARLLKDFFNVPRTIALFIYLLLPRLSMAGVLIDGGQHITTL